MTTYKPHGHGERPEACMFCGLGADSHSNGECRPPLVPGDVFKCDTKAFDEPEAPNPLGRYSYTIERHPAYQNGITIDSGAPDLNRALISINDYVAALNRRLDEAGYPTLPKATWQLVQFEAAR